MLIPPEINIFTHYSKIQFLIKLSIVKLKNGGESGIRTHERVSPKHAFQACALNHSAISPNFLIHLINIQYKENIMFYQVEIKF